MEIVYQKTKSKTWNTDTRSNRYTYIFTDGNSFGEESVNHIINQHQINHCINVSCKSKILIVVSSKSNLTTKQWRKGKFLLFLNQIQHILLHILS